MYYIRVSPNECPTQKDRAIVEQTPDTLGLESGVISIPWNCQGLVEPDLVQPPKGAHMPLPDQQEIMPDSRPRVSGVCKMDQSDAGNVGAGQQEVVGFSSNEDNIEGCHPGHAM
eukprot:1177219-Prorocentrum_minimum.AAC.1